MNSAAHIFAGGNGRGKCVVVCSGCSSKRRGKSAHLYNDHQKHMCGVNVFCKCVCMYGNGPNRI